MKQAMKSQLKNVPKDQQEKIMGLIDKNPEFFTQMAEKVKKKIDSGKPQMTAMMEVMQENKDELQKMMK
jgi:phage-related minor tail protein